MLTVLVEVHPGSVCYRYGFYPRGLSRNYRVVCAPDHRYV